MKKLFKFILIMSIALTTFVSVNAESTFSKSSIIVQDELGNVFANGTVDGLLAGGDERIEVGITDENGLLFFDKRLLKTNINKDIILLFENNDMTGTLATSIGSNGKLRLHKSTFVQFRSKFSRTMDWHVLSMTYIGDEWYLNGKVPARYGMSVQGEIGYSSSYSISGDANWVAASYSATQGFDFGTSKVNVYGTGYVNFYTKRKVYRVIETNGAGTVNRTRYLIGGDPTSAKASFSSQSISFSSWTSAQPSALAYFGAGESAYATASFERNQSFSFGAPIPGVSNFASLGASTTHSTSSKVTYTAWQSGKTYMIYGDQRKVAQK